LLSATGVALYQARLARDRYVDLRSITTSLLFDLKNAITDVPGSTAAQKILIDRVLKNLGDLTRASSDPDLQLQLAEAYRQLGELQGDPYSQNLGDSKGAIESMGKGRAISEAVLRRRPLDPACLHLAGMVEITAAEIYFGRGDESSNAVACAKAATKYFERMISRTNNAAWLVDAASAYGVLGDIHGQPDHLSFSDLPKAAQEYRRAIELDTLALKASPGSVRPLRGIAVIRMKLGDLLRPTNPQTALGEFRAASLALSGISSPEGLSPTSRRLQFHFLRKTGNALRDMQEWAEAENALTQARAYSDQQLSADPGDKRASEDVAVVASDQAYLFFWEHKFREMLEPAATLDRLSEEFIHRQPKDPKWQLSLAYSQVLLAIAESHLGESGGAVKLARTGVNELIRLA
jgi:tetratricopeptide (TPR) repeat protein